jgi:hypothetical protein
MEDFQRFTAHLRRLQNALAGNTASPRFPIMVLSRGGGSEILRSHADVDEYVQRGLKVFADDPDFKAVDANEKRWRPIITVTWEPDDTAVRYCASCDKDWPVTTEFVGDECIHCAMEEQQTR